MKISFMYLKKLSPLGIFALALLLAALFTACGGARTDSDTDGSELLTTDYVYVAEIIDLQTDAEQIQGSFAHSGRIYYWYTEWNHPADVDEDFDWETFEPGPPNLIIESILPDGSDAQRTVIPAPTDSVNISALHITEAGHFAMILMSQERDGSGSRTSVLYSEFGRDGNTILTEELDGIGSGADWFHIGSAVFAEEGIVILASENHGNTAFVLDNNRRLIGQIDTNFSHILSQTADGRVVVFEQDFDGDSSLRAVDFAAGDWGDTFAISASHIQNLYPAREGDSFDVLVDDGINLIGYNLATGTRTGILNWIETGLAAGWGYHLGFLEDGRISVLHSGWDDARDDWHSELMLLTRASRSDMPERIVLDMAGVWLPQEIREQVVAFNRQSQTHRIDVQDYSAYLTGDGARGEFDFTPLLMRLATDAPDIIWGVPAQFAAAIDQGLFADLYAHIDADAMLSRTDFFPNILGAMEAADGTLPMLVNNFSIQTLVGNADAVSGLNNWTLADMLALLRETDDANMPYVLGEWMTSERFLETVLLFAGGDFIDWDENRANLDTDEFRDLLEIAARLPHEWDGEMRRDDFVSHFTRMERGEQLLYMTHLWQATDYQVLTAGMDDVVALGLPTAAGGQHVVVPGHAALGISASSVHQDVAWDFVRIFLLPEADIFWSFPLRIDLFDEMIEDEMTPQFWTDENGNEIEQSKGGWGFDGGLTIELYAMTAAEAAGLREIVENASLTQRRDAQVMEIVMEQVLPFFGGDATAADTARILQNRIQTYLHEQR